MTDKTRIRPPPFSLRLSPEEREQLERDSAGIPLGEYIRSRIFDESVLKRRTRNKYPVKDYKLLASLLGELGHSRLANNLNQLAKAANSGSLLIDPETTRMLQVACSDIREMRRMLMKSLGLTTEN
ncbi:MAG: hypothetical protein ACE5EK_00255 [Nitrospinales bacterium]